jgi:hypothetical protein
VNFSQPYYAGTVEGVSCEVQALQFCVGAGGGVESEELGTCAAM